MTHDYPPQQTVLREEPAVLNSRISASLQCGSYSDSSETDDMDNLEDKFPYMALKLCN